MCMEMDSVGGHTRLCLFAAIWLLIQQLLLGGFMGNSVLFSVQLTYMHECTLYSTLYRSRPGLHPG